MKKALVIIVLFVILAISFTYTMINIHKMRKNSVENSDKSGVTLVTPGVVVEETDLDAKNTMDESYRSNYEFLYDYEKTLTLNTICEVPAIKFIEEEFDFGNPFGKLKITQIRGLKDKKVELKINEDIKSRYVEFLKKYEQDKTIDWTNAKYYFKINSMFSNVFFAITGFYFKEENGLKDDAVSFVINYELVNGERLHFEDLFLSNYDPKLIIAKAVYKAFESSITFDEFGPMDVPYEIYYDNEKGEWIAKYKEFDSDLDDYIFKEELYVPKYTDYDLNKIINKVYKDYKNRDDFLFYWNYLPIHIKEDTLGDTSFLYFKDIADKLIIYDKYLTKESIYDGSVPTTHRIVCSSEGGYGVLYKDTDSIGNLFYDITVGCSPYSEGYRFERMDNYPLKLKDGIIDKLVEKLISSAKEEINKYKQLEDGQKGQILLLKGIVYPYGKPGTFDTLATNVLQIELSSKHYEYDLKDKDKVLEAFLEEFNYKAVDYYGGAYNYCNSFKVDGISYNSKDLEELIGLYDVFSDEYVDSIEDTKIYALSPIFENSSKHYMFSLEERGRQNFAKEGIFNDFDFAKYYLKEMDNDTLNLGYNEIFARHGHDFKSKELKDYFSKFDWYKPIEGKVVSLSDLNEVEKKNADMILKVINDRKGKN